jgi:SAM-dependent methyltransferase
MDAPAGPDRDDDALAAALRRAELDDLSFDELYSARVRRVAHRFWTPLHVAERVAVLLEQLGARSVLDAGSGPGKFCIAAGAVAPAMHFTGIEHRPHLVEEARAIATRLSIENARFSVGDIAQCDFGDFDAVYFFNPFAENIYTDRAERFDETVELSDARFRDDILRTERALAAAKVGQLLVTYYGFGGRIPGAYELVCAETAGAEVVRIWRKTRGGGGHRVEDAPWIVIEDAD